MGAVTTNASAIQGYPLNISSPANNDVLTYDTASGKWKNAVSGGGGSQIIYTNEVYAFDTLDGWNITGITVGTGTVVMGSAGHNLQMELTANTTSDIAGIRNNKGLSWQASNVPLNIYGFLAVTYGGGAGSGDVYLRAYSSANDPSTATADQIGWHTNKASGTMSCKSSTGDGTTEQAVTLSGYTPNTANSRVNRLSFSWDGVTVSFYVDGVLKNSHVTNVPRRTTQETIYRPTMSVTASTANIFIVNPQVFNIQYPMFS